MKIDYVKDGNVISITAARTGMKFPAVAQAEGYWEGLRGKRLVPARSELDPRGLSGILEHAFILEKIAPGMAKIRLSGQGLNDILGMEMRGMPISSLFMPEARAEIQEALGRLFDGPATLHASLTSKGSFTRKALDAQLFMAPMLDDQGRVTRALGALQIKGGVDRAPRRFTFQDLSVRDIIVDEPSSVAGSLRPIFRHTEDAYSFPAADDDLGLASQQNTAKDKADRDTGNTEGQADTGKTIRRGHLWLVGEE
ncbi:PAS domain-containing protein [Aliiroseovarius crassostreae]|uniref:PAS domain-containing protein n=1 Tax=Aliiroseovarius crassostreae TaxID=154981 RepID=UPI002203F1B1|nr:PAS domain-containing protein [Aliiroseovarius crassostreae]UWP99700.1 PAS domain-containing protein [Aliiroseovarius crassostreae]